MRDNRFNRFHRVLARPMHMGRIHIQAEIRRLDSVQDLEAGRGIVDILSHMRLDTKGHAIFLRFVNQNAQFIQDLLISGFIVRFAAGSTIDDGNTNLDRRLKSLLHQIGIAGRLFYRQQFELINFRQSFDLRRNLSPAIQNQMLAHAVYG